MRVIFGDWTSGRGRKSTGLIQGRFGGAGHGSISLAAMMPVQPRTLLVGTIKTRSLPLSRRVEARPSRLFEAGVFARNFGRAPLRRAVSMCARKSAMSSASRSSICSFVGGAAAALRRE